MAWWGFIPFWLVFCALSGWAFSLCFVTIGQKETDAMFNGTLLAVALTLILSAIVHGGG